MPDRSEDFKDNDSSFASRLDAIEKKISDIQKSVQSGAVQRGKSNVDGRLSRPSPLFHKRSDLLQDISSRPHRLMPLFHKRPNPDSPSDNFPFPTRAVTNMMEPSFSGNFREPYIRVKQSRRKQRKMVTFGTKPVTGTVKGGIRTPDLFVYRVDKSVSLDALKEDIAAAITVVDLKKLSHEDALNQSFKLTIPAADVDLVMRPSFWAKGIGCRFFEPSKFYGHRT